MMHVLSIGYSKTLFAQNLSTLPSDEFERMSFYSKHVTTYSIIVPSLAKERLRATRIADNFVVYPTNGIHHVDSFIRMLLLGRKIHNCCKIDLIQTQDAFYTGLAGYILSRWYQVPLNCIVYGANPYDKNWVTELKLNRLLQFVGRFILNRTNAIQVDGTSTRDSLVKNGITSAKIYLKPMIPANISDFGKADGDAIRAQYALEKDTRVILFVGRLIKQKNLPFLFETFSEILKIHPNTRLMIIGTGAEKPKLKLMTQEMGIEAKIIWAGEVPHHEIVYYFAACDVFVLPSLYEGFARVLMEAAAAGKPIVTTDVSGASDIVLDGITGYIIPLNSKDSLRDSVLRLLTNEDLAKEMGQRAKQYMRDRYNRDALWYKQIKIWEELVRRKSGGLQSGVF